MAEAALQTRYARVQQILTEAAGRSTVDYGGLGRFWELPLAALLQVSLHGVRLIAPATAAAATGPAPGKAVHSCCGSSQATAQDPKGDPIEDRRPRYPGRAAASGLIQGLRGLAPFDGSRFPPLMWGGARVADDDIHFIAAWIDDGCPQDDREIASFALTAASPAPAVAAAAAPGVGAPDTGTAADAGATVSARAGATLQSVHAGNVEAIVQDAQRAYGVYSGSANEYKYQSGELKQRMNIDCMTETQLEKLRYALRELYELNKWPEDRRSYNNLALIHQNHCQHGWERFLPWHRIYLYEFEQALQDHLSRCDDAVLGLDHAAVPARATRTRVADSRWRFRRFSPTHRSTFLEHAQPPLPADDASTQRKAMRGKRYTSPHRFFAAVSEAIGVRYTEGDIASGFIDALLDANSLWYPLRYPARVSGRTAIRRRSTRRSTITIRPPTTSTQILSLRTFRDFGGGSLYDDSFGFIDQNPHNTMHIWTGGMNPDYQAERARRRSAPDRNKAVQQSPAGASTARGSLQQPQFGDMFSNLTASYDPVFWPVHANVDRLWWEWQQTHPNSSPADLDAILTPWSYTIRDTLDMQRFGYEYVKCTYMLPVGLERRSAASSRSRSRCRTPCDVVSIAPKSGCTAFRNCRAPASSASSSTCRTPNASTPLDHPNYAGYLAIFGHGTCYGGPGHCDPPPARAAQVRPAAAQPQHAAQPSGERDQVRRSVCSSAGAARCSITLVVIGADYQEDNDCCGWKAFR